MYFVLKFCHLYQGKILNFSKKFNNKILKSKFKKNVDRFLKPSYAIFNFYNKLS